MKQNIAEFTGQFGIILFVEKFHECEQFYAETIGLRILYRKEIDMPSRGPALNPGSAGVGCSDDDSSGERQSLCEKYGDLSGASPYHLRALSTNHHSLITNHLSRRYFTAPKVNPRTNCFCVSHPITMMGATANSEAAESLAQKSPSGLE